MERFGAATSDLASIAASEFKRSRQDVIEMNTRRLAMGDAAVAPDDLDGPLDLGDTRARVAAAEALRRYGELLLALATDSESERLAGAGDSFVASLRRVEGIDLSGEQLGAIGTAAATVGSYAVESRRMGALRDVTDAAGPAVRKLAALIKRDFDAEGDAWSLAHEAAATRLASLAERGGEAPGLSRADREAVSGAAALAATGRAEFTDVAGRIVAACDALLLAEKDVRLKIRDPGSAPEDLDAYLDRVDELVGIYRILRED